MSAEKKAAVAGEKAKKLRQKSIEERLADVDKDPRLNKIVERRTERVERKIEKAQGNEKKLAKIEKKYGYNYEAAQAAGLEPDETGHMGSLDPNTGMVLKGRKHPSMIKTRKIEKILGNKLVKKDGQLYSVPKKNNQ